MKNMKIGYYPTMEKYLKKYIKNKNFELINLGSAKRGLYLLDNN